MINKIDATDLNLLRLFVLLMRERSVTRAARVLRRGQPALSHSLARLRRAFGDELFVRRGRLLEPTSRALALLEAIEPSLDALEQALASSLTFEARTAAPVFRLGLTDDLQYVFLPCIVAELRKRVPKARLVAVPCDHKRSFDLLDRGDVNTVAGNLGRLPATAKTRSLFRARFSVLRARRSRRRLTLDAYCAGRHVLVTSAGDMSGIIDERLAEMGKARQVVLSLPHFTVLPSLLATDDLLATVPTHLAQSLSASGSLSSHPLPIPSPEYDVALAWRASIDRDEGEVLFRNILLECFKGRPHVTQARGDHPSV